MALDLSFADQLFGFAGSFTKILTYTFSAVILIAITIICVRIYNNKKRYNIPVTIWIPRSDNKIVDEVTGRGGYFKSTPVGGITTFRLKRKGVSMVEMEPPSSRFLVGLSRHLYLVQKGMDDFEPVLPDSFMTLETADKNVKGGFIRKAVVNLKCVNQDSTAWRFDSEQNAKKRFTFQNIWEKYKDFIQITIFILIVFIASYIQYNGLKDVAESLRLVSERLIPIDNVPLVS